MTDLDTHRYNWAWNAVGALAEATHPMWRKRPAEARRRIKEYFAEIHRLETKFSIPLARWEDDGGTAV